ncbi:MAG: S9 family peptidase, partial [Myxococcota bacterium]
MTEPAKPPRAEQRPHPITQHGITRDDPYHWLRDDGWQEVMRQPEKLRADVRAHLEAENAWTARVMAPTESLQEALFAEMKGRIKEDDSSVPAPDGAWAYFRRYETGAQHPRWCRRPSGDPTAPEELLYDGDAAAKGKAYFRIGSVSHSPDHRHLAVAVDDKGSEFFEIRFTDLERGEPLADVIADCNGSIAWATDGTHVLYTVLDDKHRPCKVLRHALGTPQADDVVVYEETDPGFFVGVSTTEGRGSIVISSHDHTTSEVRLVDAAAPTDPPRLVAPRTRDLEYEVSQQGDSLVILTNADGAVDFQVVRVPLATPGREHWQTEVAHREGCLILGVHTFKEWTVRLEREDGLPRIVVRSRADGSEHAIAFDEAAYALGLDGGWEFDTDIVRFTYSSPTTPRQVFDYDMRKRERTLLKTQEVPSGHEPERYRCTRILAPTADGQEVPVSILWHVDTPIDGTAPTLLYGYGAYGMTMPADFGTARLSLVDRGFVYAIAHVRGGMAKGYRWYTDGKLANKPNTFRDFVAAAEALCNGGYTNAGNITIQGGSAGGMLVGAAANLRPDLWKAV